MVVMEKFKDLNCCFIYMSFFGAIMEFVGLVFPYEIFIDPWAEKNKIKTVVTGICIFLLLLIIENFE